MLVSKTPLRVSLFGGGSDIPAFFRDHRGAVFGGAIDKFVYSSLIRTQPGLFDYQIRLAYRQSEYVTDVSQLKHAAAASILKLTGLEENIEVTITADLPARLGLGSSSSFSVGLINLCRSHVGQSQSRDELAHEAIRLERNILLEAGGWQDQIFAAFGGLNLIEFDKDGSFKVNQIILPEQRKEELQSQLFLFFTGLSRDAAVVEQRKIDRLPLISNQLCQMRDSAFAAADLLSQDGDLLALGSLLHESWLLKRSLASEVSNEEIDRMYATALAAGASGGKLLGAGAGGFLLIFCQTKYAARLRDSMARYVEVPFHFIDSGSKVTKV
jgi:D-glycero-alpha-D-manno-heptose-7-phosphate kinase